MDFIPYAKQSITDEDSKAVLKSLQNSLITRGSLVDEFERKCASFCDARYAVAFSSGTSALTAASFAANINKEDTLVSTPNTFVGTLAGALQRTSKLHLLDIDLTTGSPDFKKLPSITQGRLIIFQVHYAGIALKLSKQPPSTVVIEDACQAFGSTYIDGDKVGSCRNSDMTVFSFHPAKTICMGEGGLVTTQSKEYYEQLLLYRNNGIIKKETFDPWVYEVHALTSNSNVTTFSAALGLSQLQRVNQMIKKRRDIVARYRKNLKDIKGIEFLTDIYDTTSAHNLLPTLIDFEKLQISRKDLMLKLNEKLIGTQVHYIPIYRHPYFQKNYAFKKSDFPMMEAFYKKELSLPLYPNLELEKVDYITDVLKELFSLELIAR